MKRSKLALIFGIILALSFMILSAQEEVKTEQTISDTASAVEETTAQEATQEIVDTPEVGGFESLARSILGSGLVDLFIKGGFTMWPILALLIWAVAIIIWKFVSLTIAKINVNKFLEKIIPLLEQKKYAEAAEISKRTKGPVGAIIHQGLLKADKGVDAVEKSIENAGVLEMAFMEKGFVGLSTSISLAPMFGFFGTLVGMIEAFEAIEKAGEVDPTIVASGIKVALITSVGGLAVAIPVQFFNNIYLDIIDGIVIDMQKASEKVLETLVENK